jgi:hypothetical protein
MDSKPLIWRKFIVPADISFLRLHDTIQVAMGWTNSHLHQFTFNETREERITNDEISIQDSLAIKERYKHGVPTTKPDPYGFIARALQRKIRNSSKVKIDPYVNPETIIHYEYDFGDSWDHTLTYLESVENYKYPYPRVLEGEGDCPVEDVGGIEGYKSFLKIIKDIDHPLHQEMFDWSLERGRPLFSLRDINLTMKYCLIFKRKTVKKKHRVDTTIVLNELVDLKIGQPAARALDQINITKLIDLIYISEQELSQLHGVGPKTIRILKEALANKNLSFKN